MRLTPKADSLPVNSAILNSWKEIATYLGRGVRTVQRWQSELQLPVHRTRRSPRSPVFAYKVELDIWLHRNAKRDMTNTRSREPGSSAAERAQRSADKMSLPGDSTTRAAQSSCRRGSRTRESPTQASLNGIMPLRQPHFLSVIEMLSPGFVNQLPQKTVLRAGIFAFPVVLIASECPQLNPRVHVWVH
jgi:hypothetical protein